MLFNYWYLLITLCIAGRALSEETVYKTVTAGDDKGGRTTTITTSDKHNHLKDGFQKATSKIDKFFNGGVTVTKTLEASSTSSSSSTRAPTARKDKTSSTSSSTSSSSTSSSTTSKSTTTSSTSSSTTTSKIDPVKSALDYVTATTTTTTANDRGKATSTKSSGANRLKVGW